MYWITVQRLAQFLTGFALLKFSSLLFINKGRNETAQFDHHSFFSLLFFLLMMYDICIWQNGISVSFSSLFIYLFIYQCWGWERFWNWNKWIWQDWSELEGSSVCFKANRRQGNKTLKSCSTQRVKLWLGHVIFRLHPLPLDRQHQSR